MADHARKIRFGKFIGNVVLLLVVSVLVVYSSCPLFCAEVTTVTIPERAEVKPDVIRLGKIARVKGGDPELIEKMRSVVIGKSPLPGESSRLNEDYVKIRLKQNGIDLSQVRLEAPEKIKITRAFTEISRKEIEQIVLEFIYKKIPWDRSKVKIEDIQVNEGVILPRGDIKYEVFLPQNTDLLGTVPISILFEGTGGFHKRIWATATISVFTEVVVTKKPLRRSQIIKEEDVELQKQDLAGLPSNVISSCEKVLGKRTKRAIHSNAALRTDLVELPPLVKRGDVVFVIAESEGLKITTLGEVQESGHCGERVRVMNLDSKKSIYARVLDSNAVKVDF